MPWIPFDEGLYDHRYVENTLIDRLHFGNSADWGTHIGGDLLDKTLSYAASVVNGNGYKNPTRSKSMDVEARISLSAIAGLDLRASAATAASLGRTNTQQCRRRHTVPRPIAPPTASMRLAAYVGNGAAGRRRVLLGERLDQWHQRLNDVQSRQGANPATSGRSCSPRTISRRCGACSGAGIRRSPARTSPRA